MARASSLPVADETLVGQRDTAVLLDLLARQHAAGRVVGFEDHEAFDIDPWDFGQAWDALVRDGLAQAHGVLVCDGMADVVDTLVITAAGLARHAEAERTLVAIGAAFGGFA